MGRIQRGHIYEASGAFLVRYWTTEIVNGQPKRVQRSHFLCRRDKGKHDAINAKAVKLLRDAFMLTINSQQSSGRSLQDMRVVDFVDQKYFPYCEEIVQLTGEPRNKASTVRGYKQIWRQHFQKHFGKTTLQEYEPYMGTRFLQSLTSTQGKTTLKHVKALGGSIFKSAVIERRIKLNPWHDVEMPEDAIEPKSTAHYTLAEADDMISALVDHVDCQLILALSCFLGLRPNEIAALRWQDFGDDFIHIRFGVVRGHVDTPKTAESVAEIPLINQAGIFIELWRQKCGNPTKSYVFESRNGTPVDLHNLISRIIIPHINGGRRCVPCDTEPKSCGVKWTGYIREGAELAQPQLKRQAGTTRSRKLCCATNP